MEQLKDYESYEMEIIFVDESDVITSSGIEGGNEGDNPFGDF